MTTASSPASPPRPAAGLTGSSLLAGMFLLVLGTNLLGVILPIRGHERGAGMVAIGLYSSAWSVGFIAASIACGAMLARFGHRRAFLGLALLSGLIAGLFPLVPHDGPWIALRFGSGFGFGGAAAIIEAWLLEASPDGRSFAGYMTTTLVASLCGTLSLDVVRPEGPGPFVLAGGALLLSMLPVLLGRTTVPARPPRFSPRIALFARRSPLAAAGCLLSGLMTGAFGGLGPIFGMMDGLDMGGDTLLLAANSVGGALGYLPATLLARRCGRRTAIAAASLLGVAACVPTAWFGPRLGAYGLIAALFGIGFAQYPIYGLSVGMACAESPDRPVPAVSNEGILVFGLGTVAGPLICGPVLRTGPGALPALLGLCFAALLVGSLRFRLAGARAVSAP